MPSFDIVKSVCPDNTFRVESVIGTYDLQTKDIEERFTGNIDLPNDWNIGIIVGHSGSGKTTIAKELFPDALITNFEYTHKSILDDMPKGVSVKDICYALNSVGFSSPPSWLKPYHVLSNGEKMRCDIARAMLEDKDMFVFDEFTSVVDRNVAQIGSFALQKAIRKSNKKFIAVTCHYDVVDWLMPDWIFNTDDMTFQLVEVETQKKNRPTIKLDIYETKQKEYYWSIFRKYHYLSHSFNKAARVFIATANGELCGFCAVLPFPSGHLRNAWRGHRTVVLPDYQGVGIGSNLSSFVGNILKSEGKNFYSTTSNPSMIMARKQDKKWKMIRIGRTSKSSENGVFQNKHKRGSTSINRITVGFEYIGND